MPRDGGFFNDLEVRLAGLQQAVRPSTGTEYIPQRIL